MIAKLPNTKLNLSTLSFGDCVVLLTIVRCVFGYFVPLNILHHAPHDDLLFYRLGVSISEFDWLGVYDQLILLKGAGFPVFLALSDLLFLPLRVSEALAICLASAFFLSAPVFEKMELKTKVFIFALVVFVPFQFGALDYRILRDIIYPWILIAVLGSGCRLLWSLQTGKELKSNALIFGGIIGFFDITREESIWIVPAFSVVLLILLVWSKLYSRKNVLTSICLCLLSFSIVLGSNSLANFYAYGSSIRTEFRHGDFAYGYGQMFRFKKGHDVRRGSLSNENWENLFDKIPSARPLRDYVMGPAYKGWTRISCEAIRNQHPWESNPDCDTIMLNGYLMMALKDGIYAAGYDSPSKQSAFMREVGDDIVEYCSINQLECTTPARSMMPPETFSIEAVISTLKNLPRAFTVLLESNNPSVTGWHGSGSIFEQIKMAKFLGAKIIYDKRDISRQMPTQQQEVILNSTSGDFAGIVEAVKGEEGAVKFFGWVREPFAGWSVLLQYGKYICATELEIYRPDISDIDSPLGFNCRIPFDDENTNNAREFRAVIFNAGSSRRLDVLENVKVSLSQPLGGFDEACYLRENPDVASAVLNGQFASGFDHYKAHGFKEARPCSPLVEGATSNPEDQKLIIFDPGNSLVLNFNKFLGKIYQVINLVGLVLIPVALLSQLFRKQHAELLMLGVMASLIVTRVTLISLLDYTGMAPITALYLYSGTVLWVVATMLSGFYVCQEFQKLFLFVLESKKNA